MPFMLAMYVAMSVAMLCLPTLSRRQATSSNHLSTHLRINIQRRMGVILRSCVFFLGKYLVVIENNRNFAPDMTIIAISIIE